jgi:phosphopantothenate synthetase
VTTRHESDTKQETSKELERYSAAVRSMMHYSIATISIVDNVARAMITTIRRNSSLLVGSTSSYQNIVVHLPVERFFSRPKVMRLQQFY